MLDCEQARESFFFFDAMYHSYKIMQISTSVAATHLSKANGPNKIKANPHPYGKDSMDRASHRGLEILHVTPSLREDFEANSKM